MIEVFKTSVNQPEHAQFLLEKIHQTLPSHRANFDLDDCDNILRVTCSNVSLQYNVIIRILTTYGFTIEVLQDDAPVTIML